MKSKPPGISSVPTGLDRGLAIYLGQLKEAVEYALGGRGDNTVLQDLAVNGRVSLDNVTDGETYGKLLQSAIDNGYVLLSETEGNLDDIENGSEWGKVNISALSAEGLVLLEQAEGTLDDVEDGATYRRTNASALTSEGLVILSEAEGTLDDVEDGAIWGKVAQTSIAAGKIILTAGTSGTLAATQTEADVTAENIAAGIAGQGDLATLDSVQWDTQVDGKPAALVQTFYQVTAPTSGMDEGDYWIDSDDNRYYRYNGTSWEDVQDSDIAQALSDAADAQSTADGKVQTFFQVSAPASGMGIGDLWFDTDDSNRSYRYNGASWVDANCDIATWSKIVGSGKPADNATVGATWGTNIASIPDVLRTVADHSLAITNEFIGFHATGVNWPIRIANDGGMGKLYAGDGTNYIDWNGTALSVAGNLIVRNPATVRADLNVADGANLSSGGINLVANGDFDADAHGVTDPTAWDVTIGGTPLAARVSTPSGASAPPWHGHAFYANCDSTDDAVLLISEAFITVNTAADYCLSAWVQRVSGIASIYLGLMYYDDTQTLISYNFPCMSNYNPVSMSWHQQSGKVGSGQTHAFPEGTCYVKIRCWAQNATIGGTLISRIQFAEGLTPAPWSNVSPDADNTPGYIQGNPSQVRSDINVSDGADCTETIIQGGLVTTGRVELKDSASVTKAGITGGDTGDNAIRLWAGNTFANRYAAPFRVTQGGVMTATHGNILGTFRVGASGIYIDGPNQLIRSSSYVAATAGWQVSDVTGQTEFNQDIKIRSRLYATDDSASQSLATTLLSTLRQIGSYTSDRTQYQYYTTTVDHDFLTLTDTETLNTAVSRKIRVTYQHMTNGNMNDSYGDLAIYSRLDGGTWAHRVTHRIQGDPGDVWVNHAVEFYVSGSGALDIRFQWIQPCYFNAGTTWQVVVRNRYVWQAWQYKKLISPWED